MRGLSSFKSFCILKGFSLSLVTVDILLLYVAYLFRKKLSVSTVRVYLAGVANYLVEYNLSNIVTDPTVSRIMKGYKRQFPMIPDFKRPVTLSVMRRLKHYISLTGLPLHDQHLLWCAITLAFFGFLRSSEFLSASTTRFIPDSTLLLSDVSVPSVRSFILCIKKSKTDQFGHGYSLRFLATNRSVCALRSMLNFLQFWGESPHNQPLFTMSDGTFVTRSVLDFHQRMFSLNSPHSCITSHCFRIGAATCAAINNIPHETIQQTGRWKVPFIHLTFVPHFLFERSTRIYR